MVVGPFLEYVRLRREAQVRREAGGPPPWSEDHILQSKHFCCVLRDNDRTSLEARAIIKRLPLEQAWPAAMTFRLYNRPGTLRALLDPLVLHAPSAEIERSLRALPMVFNTVAYRVTLKGGMWNLPTLSQAIYRAARLARQGWRPRERAEYCLAQLQGELGIGPFLAYQVMQDLRWLNGPFDDEDVWCLIGGGALRGLQRLNGEYKPQKRVDYRFVNNAISGKEQGPVFSRFQPQLISLLPQMREIEPQANMFELEHNLCEYDKMERVRSGETSGRPWRPRG